jgi:hypothetical protein
MYFDKLGNFNLEFQNLQNDLWIFYNQLYSHYQLIT